MIARDEIIVRLDIYRDKEKLLQSMIPQYKARIYDLQQKKKTVEDNAILGRTYDDIIADIENVFLQPDEERLRLIQQQIHNLVNALIKMDEQKKGSKK